MTAPQHALVQPRSTKVFGREPAVILGIIAAAINLLAAYILPWNDEQIGAVNAVIAVALGFGIAIYTRDSLLAIGLGFAQALIALGSAFSFEIAADKQSAIMAFLNIVFSMFNRQTTTPDPEPVGVHIDEATPAGEL